MPTLHCHNQKSRLKSNTHNLNTFHHHNMSRCWAEQQIWRKRKKFKWWLVSCKDKDTFLKTVWKSCHISKLYTLTLLEDKFINWMHVLMKKNTENFIKCENIWSVNVNLMKTSNPKIFCYLNPQKIFTTNTLRLVTI